MTKQTINESYLEILMDTVKDIFGILRVGVREIVGKSWKGLRVLWEKYRLESVLAIGRAASAIISSSDLASTDPDLVREFGRQYNAAVQDRVGSIRSARQELAQFSDTVRTDYLQIMRPIYRDILVGPTGLMFFLTNPVAYLAVAGRRVYTDRNALGTFANSDIAQQLDLTLPLFTEIASTQRQIIGRLSSGFGAQGLVAESMNEARVFEKGNASTATGYTDGQLQASLQDVFSTPADMIADSPALKELAPLALKYIQDRSKALQGALKDQSDEIGMLRTTIDAERPEDIEKLLGPASMTNRVETEVAALITTKVDAIMENPDAVRNLIQSLKITDSSPEVVKAAIRERVANEVEELERVQLLSLLEEEKDRALKALATIERGTLAGIAAGDGGGEADLGALPLPGDPDWQLLGKFPEGRLWKKAVQDYAKQCTTLKV